MRRPVLSRRNGVASPLGRRVPRWSRAARIAWAVGLGTFAVIVALFALLYPYYQQRAIKHRLEAIGATVECTPYPP